MIPPTKSQPYLSSEVIEKLKEKLNKRARKLIRKTINQIDNEMNSIIAEQLDKNEEKHSLLQDLK